jgi:hypothetical protein
MSGSYYRVRDLENQSYLTLGYALTATEDPRGKDVVYVDSYLAASDYSGNDGGIVRTNVDYFQENVPGDVEAKLWWPLSGGHGTFGIAVLAAVLDENYEGETEEDTEAAAWIRETVESLESYPLLDEEAHSRLEMENQDAQFPDAAMDVYVRGSSGRFTFFDLLMDPFEGLLSPASLKLIEEADGVQPMEGLQSFYSQIGGEVFSTYPSTEGSGDMLSVVFHLDDLAVDVAEAVAALAEVSPESVPVLGDMLVAALYSEKPWQAFEYRSPIANALRLGRGYARKRG